MKPTAIIAALVVVLATPAAAQPLEPPNDRDRTRDYFISPPSVACPDQQTLDEVKALRRLGDRETEAITRRSYGCGPLVMPDRDWNRR